MRILFVILLASVCGPMEPWSKPIYCSKGEYVCSCDDNGDCDWILIGC